MGTFLGHLLPGIFFLAWATWAIYNIFSRYFLSERVRAFGGREGHRNATYRSTTTFPFPCCPNLPMEGFNRVGLISLAMIGEFATAFQDGKFVHYGNAQHITMYFFFALSGVVDILTFYGMTIPPDIDYISVILAFTMEALIFAYHLQGRTPMDVQVHMFLLYTVIGCVIATILECLYKKRVIPALLRTYFLILQGTWFIQIGFILYRPLTTPWDEHGPRHMMLITVIFCWHNAGVFMLMALVGWLIHLRVKRLSSTSLYYGLQTTSVRNDSHLSKLNAEQVQHIIAESEEEV